MFANNTDYRLSIFAKNLCSNPRGRQHAKLMAAMRLTVYAIFCIPLAPAYSKQISRSSSSQSIKVQLTVLTTALLIAYKQLCMRMRMRWRVCLLFLLVFVFVFLSPTLTPTRPAETVVPELDFALAHTRRRKEARRN